MQKPADHKPGPLNILVIDDEPNIRKTLGICLEGYGHRVTAVGNATDAQAFVDLRLGTESGMNLISALRAACPWLKIVVITAYASVDTAVEAIRRGATDYIPKPFKPDQVALVTERIATLHAMEQRISRLQEDLERVHPEILFKSHHSGMQRAIELARQVAPSEAVLMLRGPSGTGKSVLAHAIHAWSQRASKPLGIISCPTLSPELLESELFGHVKGAFTGALRDNPGRVAACEGGTLFLDEIGELPHTIQPKLLRFIQDREYEQVGGQRTRKADVRILAATNADLEQAVKAGRFREDLYYRLNVIQIELPPLRDRPDDTELLATTMLGFFGAQNHKVFRGFSDDALQALRNYPWPGNIRELRNVIERAAILCPGDVIGVENLPESVSPHLPPIQIGDRVPLTLIEENHIRRVLAATKSLQEAADVLGIDQATLWRKRKQFGI
ncbi:MAG: sigma-54 dependent transcriptional regulator [Desulfobacterales bacterium]|nr:sigma-54 dependent transcriptional regulator [Desulfobacterales bacterium]